MNTKSHRNRFFRFLRRLFVSLFFGVTFVGFAQDDINEKDILALIDKVIGDSSTKLPSLRHCAYTQLTTITDVGSVHERFDPSLGLGAEWQLLMVNGRDPTDQQNNDYKQKSHKRHPALLNFDFIDTNSVQLVSQSPSKLQFAFNVIPGDSTGLNQHVVNRLTVDRLRKQLIELSSFAPEPFHIKSWMRIKEYTSVSTFRFEEQTNGLVLKQVKFKLSVISGEQTLEREVTKSYSNFDCSQRKIFETFSDDNRSTPSGERAPAVPQDSAPNPGDSISR